MRVKELFAVSQPDLNTFSSLVSDKLSLGWRFESSGMSMGPLGPVWWAIMVKDNSRYADMGPN